MRARVFRRTSAGLELTGELDAGDPDEVWRELEGRRSATDGPLKAGDVVFIADAYLELNPDGGWRPLDVGAETVALYRQIMNRPSAELPLVVPGQFLAK